VGTPKLFSFLLSFFVEPVELFFVRRGKGVVAQSLAGIG
jgi:hypothetical protein